jgi:N-acetylmuramoyl-L-alanine amidase
MKKFYFLLGLCFLFCGCAEVPYQSSQSLQCQPQASAAYIRLDEFCKKYNMDYSFDTLDDVVRIHSSDKDIRLIMGAMVGYFNGSIFYLPKAPYYQQGVIMVPGQLVSVISQEKFTAFRPSFTIKTIVVDAGHGGKDPGAISDFGCQEKSINLNVARYLEKELKKIGFKVILTRGHDTFLTLQERVDVAKQYNADLFVSIHSNSSESSYLKGVEVYYLSPARLDSQARALDLAKQEISRPYSLTADAKTILWDLKLSKNYTLSVEMADLIYQSFNNLGLSVKTPRKAPYYVLRLAYVPAVLVEIGYLSNRYEEKVLRKDYYQRQLANAIANGIVSMQKRYAGN